MCHGLILSTSSTYCQWIVREIKGPVSSMLHETKGMWCINKITVLESERAHSSRWIHMVDAIVALYTRTRTHITPSSLSSKSGVNMYESGDNSFWTTGYGIFGKQTHSCHVCAHVQNICWVVSTQYQTHSPALLYCRVLGRPRMTFLSFKPDMPLNSFLFGASLWWPDHYIS